MLILNEGTFSLRKAMCLLYKQGSQMSASVLQSGHIHTMGKWWKGNYSRLCPL